MTRAYTGLLLMAALILTGCLGQDPQWHGKDIRGLMPDLAFRLNAPSGAPVTPEASAGKVRLLYFGYTSCPDVCPSTLAGLRQAIRRLPEAERDAVEVLFVSVDPRRDTPERLSSYAGFYGEQVTGLTGPIPTLRTLTRRYRTTFGYDQPDAEGNYNVSHGSAVYVFDGTGRARLLLRPGLSPQQISEDLARLIRESRAL
ncbi:SCO family protein [Marinobacter lutaoensis]|uniref:SCO family protein n=1 Tax=Marinobacter lutaoensis TaxID=135739 RepID=UPI0015942343|nr:SCO family protein [Marinobacter lutaoensis]NVD34838.1 SCO family protein [Marinobacter lutaoensis]